MQAVRISLPRLGSCWRQELSAIWASFCLWCYQALCEACTASFILCSGLSPAPQSMGKPLLLFLLLTLSLWTRVVSEPLGWAMRFASRSEPWNLQEVVRHRFLGRFPEPLSQAHSTPGQRVTVVYAQGILTLAV